MVERHRKRSGNHTHVTMKDTKNGMKRAIYGTNGANGGMSVSHIATTNVIPSVRIWAFDGHLVRGYVRRTTRGFRRWCSFQRINLVTDAERRIMVEVIPAIVGCVGLGMT